MRKYKIVIAISLLLVILIYLFKPKKIKWEFLAYKNEEAYSLNDSYFEKIFDDHTDLKIFSSKHSKEESAKYPKYCSDYIKI